MKWPPAAVATRTVTRTYRLHGVGIVVEAAEPLLSRLDRRLAAFRLIGEKVDAALRFEFEDASSVEWDALQSVQRTVYEAAGVEFRYSAPRDQLVVYSGRRAVAVCDPGRGKTRFMLGDGLSDDLELYSQTLFTICLLEHMKRYGRFGLHAAGINIGGAGLLIAGPSGAGKSTLAVLALKALGSRASFLGDDMLFLLAGQGGASVLGWPEPIDVAAWTQRMVPGLGSQGHEAVSKGRKGRFGASSISGAGPAFEAVPAVIVIPRVTGRLGSTLISISGDEALLELAPNVLLTEETSSQAHLAALATLARSCRCYRLEAGHDLDRLADVLLGLM